MGKDQPLLPPPMLLTSHGRQSEKQSFYNLLEKRYHTTRIPFLHNKSVLCSAYGWLLLLDRTDAHSEGQCCLWNPTSLEIIQLPILDIPLRFTRGFLSKPPTDPDCFILFNSGLPIGQIIYGIQENALFEFNSVDQGYLLLSVVSFKGMIYGLIQPRGTSKYEFVTLHMVGDKLEAKPILLINSKLPWEVPPPVMPSWIRSTDDYLIESPCGNELLFVTKMSFNFQLETALHFRVFRVDVARMECEELDNLDGRTIFISCDGNGFCRYSDQSLTGAAVKPNSIYYTNWHDMVMHVYDLDDRSTMTLSPYPGADIDPNTVESYWVDLTDIPMKNSLYFHVY